MPDPQAPIQAPEHQGSDGVIHTIHDDGSQTWQKNGLKHRDGDQPAEIEASGTQNWYQNGMRHRVGGPAIIRPGGEQLWYRNNLLHRRDGPAYENGDHKEWYDSGRLHRIGGPAVEGHGDPEQNWWEFGVQKPAPLPPGTPIEVKLGTNKLRQLRDTIESRGGSLSRKDLPSQLPPELKPLLGPRGDLSAHSIQELLDKKPGLKFEITEGEWNGGQRHNNSPSKVMQLNVTPEQRQAMQAAGVDKTFDSMMDASRQSNHPVKKNTIGWVRYTHEGGETQEQLRAQADKIYAGSMGSFTPEEREEAKADYIKDNHKSPSIFMDEVQSDFGQSFGKRAQAEARQQALEDLPGQLHPDYLNDLSYAAERGRMSDDDMREKAEWLVNRHGDAMTYDPKTGENVAPDDDAWNAAVENRMDEIQGDETSAHRYALQALEHAKAGEFDDARNAANAAHNQGYNYQPFVELIENPQTVPPDINSLTPEQQQHIESKVAAARDAAEAKWPEAHQQKINQILFGGRHPNEILHEAFHEHMRQKGHVGTPISIWTPESKAPQSQLDPDKPIPAHMVMTYGQIPQKMGMQRLLYGQPPHSGTDVPMRAAESGNHHSNPIWADVVRKTEDESRPSPATLTGTAHQDKGVKKFRVSALAVDKKVRRHGVAKVLYHHMLKDNGGRAESDTMVSPDAQGFYEGLSRDPKYRVKLGDDTINTRHGVELSKSLKNTFMALAAAGAMHAGTANAPAPEVNQSQEPEQTQNMSPAPQKTKWTPAGLHPDLYPIAHLESSFGQKMDHAKHSKGDFYTAFGAVALKPVTAFDRYHHDKALQTMFPGVGDDEQKFVTEFKANPLFYNSIASSEWNHMKRVFGGDQHRSAYGWRWGQEAAHEAPAENVIADPYVKAWDKLSNRLKSREELAKGLKVEHYSGVGGLKTLDPRKQGTGMPGKEAQRTDRIPRTFVYTAGAKPESHIGTLPHKYEAELDPGINLYDMSKDPLGLLKPKKRQTNYGIIHEPVDLSAVEKKIRRLGYHGYKSYSENVPDAIALFSRTPVKQIR